MQTNIAFWRWEGIREISVSIKELSECKSYIVWSLFSLLFPFINNILLAHFRILRSLGGWLWTWRPQSENDMLPFACLEMTSLLKHIIIHFSPWSAMENSVFNSPFNIIRGRLSILGTVAIITVLTLIVAMCFISVLISENRKEIAFLFYPLDHM